MKRYGWIIALLAAMILTGCADTAEEETREPVTLVYASISDSGGKQMVDTFNRNHRREGIRIEYRKYLDEDGRSGRDRLLTEILAGDIPDIIDLGDGSGLPYLQMVRKGYLEDLWPYIENDPDLGAEGALWEAPLKAAEIGGGLYALFPGVIVRTLVGDADIVGDRYSWALSDLRETLSSMPDNSTVMEFYRTKSEIFSYVFRMSVDSYVDWDTCETDFDSGRFRAALEFVNSFPDEYRGFDFEGGEARAEDEAYDYWRAGQQMLSMAYVVSPRCIQALNAVFGHGGQAGLVGYPVEDGRSGSFFQIQGSKMAMSSACRNKEAAWKFIRQMIMPQGHTEVSGQSYIPINHEDYDKAIRLTVRPQSFWVYWYFNENITYKIRPASKEQIARFEDFINSIDRTDLYDTTLYDIVYDACGPYFAGDRTMDETIRLLDNRVSVYLHEQK